MKSSKQSKKGSVFGGMLLITGSSIGAGMLGLPILTGLSGFFPSLIMFVLAWIFMTTTALLMVEILGWFKKPVNLLTLVSHTLGVYGKILCWILYLFLFYALLVAYMSLSGNHAVSFSKQLFHLIFPDWMGTFFFVFLFGWLVYLGTKQVDHLNRLLMIGKIGAYLLLVFIGIHYIKPQNLFYSSPKYTLFAFPVLIISFGFHNMVPSLMAYLNGNRRRVRQAIWGGSIFAFIIYFIWNVISLGVLPVEKIRESYSLDIDAAQMIQNFLQSSVVGYSAQALAFFAILTSFLAQSLSLVHFLRDGLSLPQKEREHLGVCLLALIPPLVFSLLFPQIFFQALNFAGGICAVVLFGILPILMTWVGRYRKNNLLPDRVWGGKPLLLMILLISCFIFFYQLSLTLNIPLFPKP